MLSTRQQSSSRNQWSPIKYKQILIDKLIEIKLRWWTHDIICTSILGLSLWPLWFLVFIEIKFDLIVVLNIKTIKFSHPDPSWSEITRNITYEYILCNNEEGWLQQIRKLTLSAPYDQERIWFRQLWFALSEKWSRVSSDLWACPIYVRARSEKKYSVVVRLDR